MSKKSRDKGKRGEREASTVWGAAVGREYQRGEPQSRGAKTADIEPKEGTTRLWIEVKRGKTIRLSAAVRQAARDSSGSGRVPMVLHRRDNEEWLVTVRLSDLVDFAGALVTTEGDHG